MIIERECKSPGPCDICGAPSNDFAHVARGATGRWCEVLWICQSCAGKGGEPLSAEEARQRIGAMGGGDYADF